MDLREILSFKKMKRTLLLGVLPAGIFYAGFVLLLRGQGFGTIEILQDPLQYLDAHSLTGVVSNLGNALWLAAGAIAFFAAGMRNARPSRQRELPFLIGLLSLTLAVDDFFLIHDRYVNETYCYFFYATVAGALLLRHFFTILQVESFAYLMAGGLLAASIATDLMQYKIMAIVGGTYGQTQVFEEGFKFMGAATWLYFACRMAAYRLEPAQRSAPTSVAA